MNEAERPARARKDVHAGQSNASRPPGAPLPGELGHRGGVVKLGDIVGPGWRKARGRSEVGPSGRQGCEGGKPCAREDSHDSWAHPFAPARVRRRKRHPRSRARGQPCHGASRVPPRWGESRLHRTRVPLFPGGAAPRRRAGTEAALSGAGRGTMTGRGRVRRQCGQKRVLFALPASAGTKGRCDEGHGKACEDADRGRPSRRSDGLVCPVQGQFTSGPSTESYAARIKWYF